MQTPSVGRMVHYHLPHHSRVKGQPYPAIITHVFGPSCVNLSVCDDGSFHLEPALLHPTSVMLIDPEIEHGAGWSWPPYVK